MSARPAGFTGTPEQAARAAEIAARLHAKRGTSTAEQLGQWEALALFALANGHAAPLPPSAQRHLDLIPGPDATPGQRRTWRARLARAENRARSDAGKRMVVNLPPDAADLVRQHAAETGLSCSATAAALIKRGSTPRAS